jgi:hypothetical protein
MPESRIRLLQARTEHRELRGLCPVKESNFAITFLWPCSFILNRAIAKKTIENYIPNFQFHPYYLVQLRVNYALDLAKNENKSENVSNVKKASIDESRTRNTGFVV